MAKYNITYRCGHTGVVNLVGPTKERQYKIDWYQSEECPDCQYAHVKERAQAAGLPELRGTERQVHWAEFIRERGLKELENGVNTFERLSREAEAYHREAGFDLRHVYIAMDRIKSQTSASWWIDNQYEFGNILRNKLEEVATDMTRLPEESARQLAEEEMILKPEDGRKAVVCEITIKDDCVTVKSEYDPDMPPVVKKYGFKWNGKTWKKDITFRNAPADERAVEIGNKLLCAGFPVKIKPELHDKVVNGQYDPEHTRWISHLVKRNMFSISWDYRQDPDIQKAVSRVPSVRMGRYGEAEAPVSAWEAILEMAELNDFRLSPGAQEAISEYRSRLEVVSPTAVAEKVYESHDNELRKILDSSRDVLDDLREENG